MSHESRNGEAPMLEDIHAMLFSHGEWRAAYLVEQHCGLHGLEAKGELFRKASQSERRDSGWIAVDDRLPNDREDVLVVEYGEVKVFRLCIPEQMTKSRGITHWMPAPLAPNHDTAEAA